MYVTFVGIMSALFSVRLTSALSFVKHSPTSVHRDGGLTQFALSCRRRCMMSTSLVVPRVEKESSQSIMDSIKLEKLASGVVHGLVDKVSPQGSYLRRRRSWHLFLEPTGNTDTAILVVDKKSTFTLDDARTALAIIDDESVVRQPQRGNNLRQLLVAIRADVAPSADAFVKGLQAKSSQTTNYMTLIRWEELESLVQDSGLGDYLTSFIDPGKGSRRMSGPSPLVIPHWLVEERQRVRDKGGIHLFDIRAPFEPSGDQPEAIEALTRGIARGKRHQTLLGATGTGKTFIIANVIKQVALPSLVLAPNKVLAAQLTNELRALFPKNAVEYFVSYYDYYTPEAFNSASDTYIDKVVQVNDDIDRMRHSATRSLLERNDVIVVASVSCIYGLGMPSQYLQASVRLAVGQAWPGGWRSLSQHLEKRLSYEVNHTKEEFEASPRGNIWRASTPEGGGVIEVGPAADEAIVRVSVDTSGVIRRIRFMPTGDAAGREKDGKAVLGGLSAILSAGGMEGGVEDGINQLAPPIQQIPKVQDGGSDVDAHVIYPAKHHVVADEEMEGVLSNIAAEMEERCAQFGQEGRWLEAERLRQRTENDMLLLRTVGTCKGVENYSRHLAGREEGHPPTTLVDYFPEDEWLLVADESHVSVPQLGAMWAGDRARKLKLVEHGFRLPSALDNRPLKAEEFWAKVSKTIFLSATPGKLELELSNPERQRLASHPHSKQEETSEARPSARFERSGVADMPSNENQPKRLGKTRGHDNGGYGWDLLGDMVDAQAVIRPTGITDPPIDIRPTKGQVADLVQECRTRGKRGERVLVTALTKRMAEDLCAFLVEQGVASAYLHSDIKPMHRLELLRQLRSGEVDAMIGVNLLREGLNLPEVSLVCILDADAEGFLRSDTALLQTIGRATRHQAGQVVLYADRITPAMRRAIAETDRRRDIQIKYNEIHGITPSVAKAAAVGDSLLDCISAARDNKNVYSKRDAVGQEDGVNGLASWTDASLPPDQVQLLYDIAARKSEHRARGRLVPVSASTSPHGDATSVSNVFTPSEGTSLALKRLAEQAAEKMAYASKKTNFKEAALWRDRRDALLSTMHELELGETRARGDGDEESAAASA